MNRDDFSQATKELLAKRVGHRCSNPQCRQTTSGPQEDPVGAVNIGVACHITAASPGGPRYDPALTSSQRSVADNGIWLCQTWGKLIDSDLTRYTTASLSEWKLVSEQSAAQALASRRSPDEDDGTFLKIERLMPELLAEMRTDLAQFPLCREFVVLKKTWVFWYPEHQLLTYYYEDPSELDNKLRLLENLRLIRDIQGSSNVARFTIEEPMADYLMTSTPRPTGSS